MDVSFDALIQYVASGFLGVITVSYFIETVKGYRDVVDSPAWTRAEGEVITSEIKRSGGSRSAEACIEYRFVHNGEEYIGDAIKPGFHFSWTTPIPGLNSATRWTSKYPQGMKVDVYYDSSDPTRCCLEHRSINSMIAMNLFGFGMLAFMLYLFFVKQVPFSFSL